MALERASRAKSKWIPMPFSLGSSGALATRAPFLGRPSHATLEGCALTALQPLGRGTNVTRTDRAERESLPVASRDERAKHLPVRQPFASTPPELVPARMINEALYCERLMYLEWVQDEFTDNEFTVDGRTVHQRADRPGGTLGKPAARTKDAPGGGLDAEDGEDDEPEGERPYTARSIWLSSEALGMTAKLDVVEGSGDGVVIPVEYKRGAIPDVPEGAFLPERAQVCAQVLILRDNGYDCPHGEIYFARSRRRVVIDIDDDLIERTREAARRVKELTGAGTLPEPLVDSSKCDGCSLVGICLPDETNLLRGVDVEPQGPRDDPEAMAEFWTPEEGAEDTSASPQLVLRRLQPARDDKVPLYVQEQGAKISLVGEELIVKSRDGQSSKVRLPNTSQITLLGNVQISTQAIRAVLERGISLNFMSSGGWLSGRASGIESKNIELRVAQHRILQDREIGARLARGIIRSKIRNARTMLRRNHPSVTDVTLFELEQLAKKAECVDAIESLLGVEGTAARSYFAAFSGMLKGRSCGDFDLAGRNRRPPRDPVNALLSLAYSLLTKEFVQAISASGLDPLLGFYHQPRFGRPALALDLMEEFRPILADSTVISAINGGVVTVEDFEIHPTGTSLKSHARRRFIQAFERRMDQLVTHPVFGYRVSYRRVLEVQARLFGRFLLGEIADYPEFRTR